MMSLLGCILKRLLAKEQKKEKMAYIGALYDYATRDLNVDPNNYRIMIKSRNNPMNKIRE